MQQFFLIFGLAIITFVAPSRSAGLFEEGELTSTERRQLQNQIRFSGLAVKAVDAILMLVMYGEFEKGNCEEFADVDSKAKQGDAKYQYILGDLLQKGLCVKQDDKKSLFWWWKAAKQDYVNAQHDLAVFYLKGRGTPVQPSAAAHWFLKAAQQGEVQSQYAIGQLYGEGKGVLQNYAEAMRWYEKAAQQRHGPATLSLANMYLKGEGVERDTAQALRWVLKGVGWGFQPAQAIAAQFYLDGIGTEPKPMQAHKWANLAASSQNQKVSDMAISLRDRAEKRLSSIEVAQAQKMASEWKPEPPQVEIENQAKPSTKLPIITDPDDRTSNFSPAQAKALLKRKGVSITKDAYFTAVEQDNLPVFKMFHRAGADLETTRTLAQGVTALYSAVDYGSQDVYRYLMDNDVNVNAREMEGGMTPLVRAIAHERWEIVDELLNAGADASQPRESLPEYTTSLLSGTALNYALSFPRPNLVRRLLKQGATVNERYIHGDKPLLWAVKEGHTENVQVLLEAGASVHEQNEFGATPVLVCVSRNPANKQVLRLLLSNGASASQTDKPGGHSPMFFAALVGDAAAIDLLLEYGANPNEKYRLRPSYIPMIVEDEVLRDVIMNGGTPLMIAAALGHISAAKILIGKGADLSMKVTGAKGTHTVLTLAEGSGVVALDKYIRGRM